MLQNCHLSVEFCDEIIQTISDTETIHEGFKLWITSEINKNFPMSLLQMSIKYTNEPPQGIRSGLKRIYSDICQDNLDYSSNDSVYACQVQTSKKVFYWTPNQRSVPQ